MGRASLETLAIVAYRQPITKSEIEEIRGVDVSANIKTLMDLQLIRLVGKSELPGHPFLYGTTPLFLEHFGLASLQQLNEIDPTLQRSNPRTKAAQYKKPVTEKTDLEKAAEEAVAEEEAKETISEEKVDEKKSPSIEQAELDVDDEVVVNDDLLGDDDDDIFIDDTPDEFDDDDDDDDDEEDDEEEDENEK